MRIAFIGRDLPRSDASGGVAGQMHLLAQALVLAGHEVTACALNEPPPGSLYEYQAIPIPPAMMNRRRAALYLAPWWARRISFDGFDIVHSHGEDQFIGTRRPVVRTFYGAERAEARHSKSWRRMFYHLSMVPFEWVSERRAAALVVISRSVQRYLSRTSFVIPCGFDPHLFHPGGPKSSDPSILFVGALGTRKRAELLLRVFGDEIRSAFPEAQLWMVTDAAVDAPGVRSFRHLRPEALGELYRKAWVFCMPSSYEGFGVPYVEAMASGTPVVATPNGGAQEVLDEGRAGVITTESRLGSELMRLLKDRSAREEFAARGVARALGYESSRIAQQYIELYKTVLATPR